MLLLNICYFKLLVEWILDLRSYFIKLIYVTGSILLSFAALCGILHLSHWILLHLVPLKTILVLLNSKLINF